jgi:hypothetical protein
MAHNLDESGRLILADLTEAEQLEIYEKTRVALESTFKAWFSKYGTGSESFEVLDEEQEVVDEIRERVGKVDEKLVWTEMNYDTGSSLRPVEGIDLLINGTAVIPGLQEDGFYDTVEAYWVSSVSLDQPYTGETIYRYAQCLCPFCNADEDQVVSCSIPDCDSNWVFEID